MSAAKKLIACVALASLAACASNPRPRIPDQIINRALAGAPGEAQPGKIVAREIAFARAAREDGQWTAFRAFAAPGAVMHGRDGPIVAEPWLAAQSNPAKPVQWEPRAVWMSCNGALAVSQGRFRDPDGIVGNFITVWERQSDNEYKWVYDVGTPDDPQPPPPKPIEDGDIVVTSIDAVKAGIADCPRGGTTIPAPPAFSLADDFTHGGKVSDDGTLRWRWEHREGGKRRVVVDYFYLGKWQNVVDEDMSARPVAGSAN
ncbi:hypothetical protein G6N82_07430 [Altererythrobacter sp. BO-6]|uniref:hypothetical protein n=1 Tax=Altererythrobacter sp. BO-6 TaxID=2604537 RepID=UPI0013E1455E|nr:hypothetical protein [Altererythrobacter sp. BO-6]QIG54004.1 hypothetical protein G6N82_07430 [Altererythrobacter sp. BO-6]